MVLRLMLSVIQVLIGGLITVSVSGEENSSTVSQRPNIVLFYIDDFGWRDTGFNGSLFYDTPNMDRLAKEGMNFVQAYANAPNCAPSRACLMSGLYSPRHGIYTVGKPDRGPAAERRLIPAKNKTVLGESFVTFPERLKNAGYRTAFLGKWHLGEGEQTGPMGQGFDVNVGGLAWGHPKGYFSPYRNPYLKDGPKGEYLTDRLNEEADQLIGSYAGQAATKPFFICLSHYAVHTPIQAKPELAAKFSKRKPTGGQNNAKYAAMIKSVDEGIGMVLDSLRKHQIEKQTLVILYSDNGGMGAVTSNAPLRGAKGMMYEGGIRVPLVMRWPGMIPGNSQCNVPVIGTDFYPTFCELAKTDPIANLDGESLVSLLKGESQGLKRDAIYWHFPAYLQGGQKGAYRNDRFFRTRPSAAIRQGEWKLIQYFEDDSVELFHLKSDLSESRDLAASQPEKKNELLAKLKSWQSRVSAPIPTKQNPAFKSR